jgi:hypothetical protein
MDETTSPPKSGLGVWLVQQACELREAISALATDVTGYREETKNLRKAVDRLVAEAERSAMVQATQGIELEQVKLAAAQA